MTISIDRTSIASGTLRWLKPAAHWIAFAVGTVLVIAASRLAWEHVGRAFQADFSSLSRVATAKLEYDCWRPECVRCLSGIEAHPDGIIVTGASGAIYAFDFTLLQGATSRPIIDCTMTNASITLYKVLFTEWNKLKRDQIMLHFVNTWEPMFQWNIYKTLFLRTQATEAKPAAYTVYLQRLQWSVGWFQQIFRVLQIRLRNRLSSTYPEISEAIEFFPVGKSEHVRRKAKVMERWISISPYHHQMIENYKFPSREEIRNQLQSLKRPLSPINRQVFVPPPEYTAITNAQDHDFFARLKILFVEEVKAVGSEYVDVDYSKCGLQLFDFWKGPGSAGFDALHVAPDSRKRMTECLMKELIEHGSLR